MAYPDFSDLLYPTPAPATAPAPAVSTTPAPAPAPSPAPATSGDDASDPNMAFKNMLGGLMGGGNGGQQPDLFTVLIMAFVSMLTGGKGLDFGADGDAKKSTTQLNTERNNAPDYKEAAVENLAPSKLAPLSERLNAIKTAEAGKNIQAISPVKADVVVTSQYGHRTAPKKGASTEHMADDLAPTVKGTNPEIVAPMHGIVINVGWNDKGGNMLDIMDGNGVRHHFAHLKSISAKVGDEVLQGQTVAVMGSTGDASTATHLHYSTYLGKQVQEPEIFGHTMKKGSTISIAESNQLLAAQSGNNATMVASNTNANTTDKPATSLPNNIQSAVNNMDFSYLQQGGYVNTSVSNPKQTTVKTIGA